jgi:hypothetical protein
MLTLSVLGTRAAAIAVWLVSSPIRFRAVVSHLLMNLRESIMWRLEDFFFFVLGIVSFAWICMMVHYESTGYLFSLVPFIAYISYPFYGWLRDESSWSVANMNSSVRIIQVAVMLAALFPLGKCMPVARPMSPFETVLAPVISAGSWLMGAPLLSMTRSRQVLPPILTDQIAVSILLERMLRVVLTFPQIDRMLLLWEEAKARKPMIERVKQDLIDSSDLSRF